MGVRAKLLNIPQGSSTLQKAAHRSAGYSAMPQYWGKYRRMASETRGAEGLFDLVFTAGDEFLFVVKGHGVNACDGDR